VLVADDSPIALRVLTRTLADHGLPVRAVSSASEARAVDTRGVAVAVLDLDLGDGSGVDVAEALRAARPVLPIAFFSSGASPAVVARARAIGPIFDKLSDLDALTTWVESELR